MKELEGLVQARPRKAMSGGAGISLTPKYSAFLKSQDPAWQAEEFRKALGSTSFSAYVRATFGKREVVAEPHHLIASLGFSHS